MKSSPQTTAFQTLRALRRDRSGLALLEFALSLPLVLGIGCYGVELGNLALLNMKVSQIALNLADNASRVGASGLTLQQLREVDVNDVLQAARYQGTSINLTTNGRIILTSLENVKQDYDTAPVQRIHWQRCLGMKSGADYDSHYGTTTVAAGSTATQANKGTDDADGMGPTGSLVTAPPDSAVMFVEINYLTRPLFGTFLTTPARIQYIASFIVRDRRDFSQLFNPVPAVATASKSTCNLYTT